MLRFCKWINTLMLNVLFADNLKPKKPVDLSILKKEQEVFDNIDDDDDDEDSDEEDEKDDLDDLGDNTELSDDPNAEDDDDDEDDDIYDDDIDWDTTPSSTTSLYKQTSPTTTTTTTTTTARTTVATPDPYFTHFDPRNEHESYKEAQVMFRQFVWNLYFLGEVMNVIIDVSSLVTTDKSIF